MAKHPPCAHCGTKYSRFRLRCPKCHLPREGSTGPFPAKDRLVGLVLVILGGVIGFGICYFLVKTRFLRHAVFLVIPGWLLLHGTILLAGIHIRDFHAWWNQLSPIPRGLIQLLGWIAFIGLILLLIWAGASRPPGRTQLCSVVEYAWLAERNLTRVF